MRAWRIEEINCCVVYNICLQREEEEEDNAAHKCNDECAVLWCVYNHLSYIVESGTRMAE